MKFRRSLTSSRPAIDANHEAPTADPLVMAETLAFAKMMQYKTHHFEAPSDEIFSSPSSSHHHRDKHLKRSISHKRSFVLQTSNTTAAMTETDDEEEEIQSATSSSVFRPEQAVTTSHTESSVSSEEQTPSKAPLRSSLKRPRSVEDPAAAAGTVVGMDPASEAPETESTCIAAASSCSPPPSKHVTFTHLDIYVHEIRLGDNPSVMMGPPLTIAWKACSRTRLSVQDYEDQFRSPKRKTRMQMIRNRNTREDILVTLGYTQRDILRACERVLADNQSRMESVKDFSPKKKGWWKRFTKVFKKPGEPKRVDSIRVR